MNEEALLEALAEIHELHEMNVVVAQQPFVDSYGVKRSYHRGGADACAAVLEILERHGFALTFQPCATERTP